MAFFCPGAAHGSAKKKAIGSKPGGSLSQGTTPITPGFSSIGSEKASESGGGGGGERQNVTITLPHSNTQSVTKKLIVVQKYEPATTGEKGLAVNRGDTVLLVRDDGDWMYVRKENGEEGYVPRSHLLSPSRTRTRTSSRSGTAIRHVASNGCVETHSTSRPDNITSPTVLSQDEGHRNHINTSYQPPPPPPPPRKTPTNEILYDRKMYSPSPSSGVASLADQFSPGSPHSPMQDRGKEGGEQVQSSSSSLDQSRESCSSFEQDQPHGRAPTLISPLNHIEGGRESYQRGGGGGGGGGSENMEGIPRSNSTSSRSTGDSVSARGVPVQNGVHYVDKTTNHIYSTLEQPTSPPPPPLPPRNASGFSASQDPEPNVYSQLEHPGLSGGRTCSQEAIVHPSHHNSFSEGWTRDRKIAGHPTRSASAKSRPYKEAVEIRHNTGSPRVRQRGVPPPPLKVLPQPDHLQKHQRPRQSNWNNGVTKITKFRKTVWGVFVVAHDFDPMDENEIAIRKGEHVSVWNQDDRDWFWVVKHASSGQEEGFVPSGCLREVSTDSKISIRSGSSVCHTPNALGGNSPRLDDLDPMQRHRTHSQDSHRSNPTPRLSRPPPPRPSSGGTTRSNGSNSSMGHINRERRSSESGSQVHRVHHSRGGGGGGDVAPLSLPNDPLPPPLPPSSPPPPYTEFDTNRRFMSLSQQPGEVHHHSQPTGGGYMPGMHRTRSQGYVTSRTRVMAAQHHHYPPSSPSSPHPLAISPHPVGGGTLV